MDRAREAEKAIRRQEQQVRVRKRVEVIHLPASTRECDAVSRVKIHIDVPFDQPGKGEESVGGDAEVREVGRNIVHILPIRASANGRKGRIGGVPMEEGHKFGARESERGPTMPSMTQSRKGGVPTQKGGQIKVRGGRSERSTRCATKDAGAMRTVKWALPVPERPSGRVPPEQAEYGSTTAPAPVE